MPDKPNMFIKDFTMYKAFYCGLCKTIGKNCSQMMRFSTNYDITFLDVLAHAVFDKQVEIVNEGCVLNPLKKKSIVVGDEITKKVVDINNILLHYKCVDDIVDNKSVFKKIVDKLILRRHYKKSKNKFKELDNIISKQYDELRVMEKENCGTIDAVCDKFANIMSAIGKEVFQDKVDDNLNVIMYNIGKHIYIADAIDDIQDDFEKGKYNMFLVGYSFISREQFLKDKNEQLNFLLGACVGAINEAFDNLKFNKFDGVLTNIFWYGLKKSDDDLLRRTEKCKKIRF